MPMWGGMPTLYTVVQCHAILWIAYFATVYWIANEDVKKYLAVRLSAWLCCPKVISSLWCDSFVCSGYCKPENSHVFAKALMVISISVSNAKRTFMPLCGSSFTRQSNLDWIHVALCTYCTWDAKSQPATCNTKHCFLSLEIDFSYG